MNKTTIYILSEFFAPFQNVGSVKFSKIAKYLSENPNYKIIVFSRKNENFSDIFLEEDLKIMKKNCVDIFYVDEGKRFYQKPSFFSRAVEKIKRILYGPEKYYYDTNQKASNRFVRGAMKIIDFEKLPTPQVILSTYDDWGAHYLAEKIKQKFQNLVWIADFRDPIGAFIKKGKYRKLCDAYSFRVSEYADIVTAVSQGTFKNLMLKENCKKILATNGFDFADLEYAQRYNIPKKFDSKLRFVYAGSFYNTTLLPFFHAIRDLLDEKLIEEKNIEIVYAGSYGEKIFSEIEKTHLQNVYKYAGILSRLDAVLLQNEADVLLTSVWNYKDYEGVIGGKFLQYLMLKKTIIAICMGDKSESEIKKLIEKINCGFCYEEANHVFDYEKLKKIILELYKKKMQNEIFSPRYNETELEKFNLKNIAIQYEKTFLNLLSERGISL